MKKPHGSIYGLLAVYKKRILIIVALTMTLATYAFTQTPPPDSAAVNNAGAKQYTRTIRLTVPIHMSSYHSRFLGLIYNEAFARLGYGVELHALYPERRLVESNSGRMDGEAGRIRFDSDLAAKYPNLLRVTEPLITVTFAAFATDADIRLNSWKDFGSRNLVVGYPRGIKLVEKRLSSHVDEQNIYKVVQLRQGLRMLRRGRINVLIDVKVSVEHLLGEAEFIDSGIVLAASLEVLPVFPYLHKKHRSLVPKLAAVLKSMKQDGTYDRLVEEVKKRQTVR